MKKKSWIWLVVVFIVFAIALAPFTACAQPSFSEMDERYEKMLEISEDLSDLVTVSLGNDQMVALVLMKVAISYVQYTAQMRGLIYSLTQIKNDVDRNSMKSLIAIRTLGKQTEIDMSIDFVTEAIAMAQSQAIILAGKQLKKELRKLKKLLSSISRELEAS